jgi:hypothetical protein
MLSSFLNRQAAGPQTFREQQERSTSDRLQTSAGFSDKARESLPNMCRAVPRAALGCSCMKNRVVLILAVPLLFALTGCTLQKTENPLSPTVAGPLPGVNITAPNPVSPRDGIGILVEAQPISLILDNASTSGPRPLSYTFDVSTDAAFSSIVVTRSGIAPGEGGRTTFTLPSTLQARTYYWRSRAYDGANESLWSAYATFEIAIGAVYQPPGLVSPANGSTTSNLRPTFVWNNAARTGLPAGTVMYEAEGSDTSTFADKVSVPVAEQPGQTSVVLPQDLVPGRTFYWRVRAFDSKVQGPWSDVQSFKTPATSTGGGGTGGGGGGGFSGGSGWESCNPVPGEDLVRCIRQYFPYPRTEHEVFEITKRVAWLLRGQGFGLLIKRGGENVIPWQDDIFSASRVVERNGHFYKTASAVGTPVPGEIGNGPSWQDEGIDPGLAGFWHAPIDPSLP